MPGRIESFVAVTPTVATGDSTSTALEDRRAALIAKFVQEVSRGSFDADFADNPVDAPADDAPVQECPECGAEVPTDDRTCPACGAPMPDPDGDGDATTEEVETAAVGDDAAPADVPVDAPAEGTPTIDPANPGGFRAILCVENERTADDRMIAEGATTWRPPPLSLMMQDTSGHGSMAGPAVVAGVIQDVQRDGLQIIGTGNFLANDTNGTRAAMLVASGALTSVSIDGGDTEWDFVVEETDEDGNPVAGYDLMTAVTILAATMVPMPAIQSAKIERIAASAVTDEEPVIEFGSVRFEYLAPEALTAALAAAPADIPAGELTADDETPSTFDHGAIVAAGGVRFPIGHFANPEFTERTPITVTDDGRVMGHLAVWGECHTGFDRECVLAPRSRKNYAYFLTGSVRTDADTNQPVGTITMGTGHADQRLSPSAAIRHYDSTALAVAYVNAGEDGYGIWLSGVIKPGITDEQITEMTAGSLSGDWRLLGGSLELIASLAVNVPGFPVARVKNGETLALVAAGFGHRKPTVSILQARLDHVAQSTEQRLVAAESRVADLSTRLETVLAWVRPRMLADAADKFRS